MHKYGQKKYFPLFLECEQGKGCALALILEVKKCTMKIDIEMTKVEQEYGANEIQVLEDLKRSENTGMYIGSTGPRGLHHLVYEICR